jgi:hypothetical protein
MRSRLTIPRVSAGSLPAAVHATLAACRRLSRAQRRFALWLGAMLAVLGCLFLGVEDGAGIAVLRVALLVVAIVLVLWVWLRRRMLEREESAPELFERRAVSRRIGRLAVALVSGLIGLALLECGVPPLSALPFAVMWLSFRSWWCLGRGRRGRRVRSAGEATAETPLPGAELARAGGPIEVAAGAGVQRMEALALAQLDYLWALSAMVVCSFTLLLLVFQESLEFLRGLVAPGGFLVLMSVLLARLICLSWPALGGARGPALLRSALVSTGIMVSGMGLVLYLMLGTWERKYFFDGLASPSARSPAEAGVVWGRSLPAEDDPVRITPEDINLATGGSVYERVADAIVTLRSYGGEGTAFLITRDGLALTAAHVVARAGPHCVWLRSGEYRRARVVRVAEALDVALVQIDCGRGCRTVELGSNRQLEVGMDLLVIGTPQSMDLHHTVTKGVLRGVRRDAEATLIQTDAAVNPGNSGGPILDARSGRVLGILTHSWAADTEGLHFGVAISDALRALRIER